ncbi:hypothetical protein MASR2M8_23280 [Opitutaceae bacterium]
MPEAPLRIALFGPESTGKSSLAERLAVHFGEPWAPEYVRGFWDEHDGRIVAGDLDAIARGQISGEEAAAAKARRVMFADTELLTNVLWADLLFPGHCPVWVRAEADMRARRFALYLLCDTDLAFEPDPQRCFPDDAGRERCRRLWLETLETRKLPYVRIRGDWSSREALAINAVRDLLAR